MFRALRHLPGKATLAPTLSANKEKINEEKKERKKERKISERRKSGNKMKNEEEGK